MTEFEFAMTQDRAPAVESPEGQLAQCRAVLRLIWSKYVVYALVDSEDLDAVKRELPEICGQGDVDEG